MKKPLSAGAASLLAIGLSLSAAAAQTTPTTTTPPSVAKPDSSGPQAGANSFTEDQAQARIADAGYTSVSGLKKANDGVWHGVAMKNGQQVNVWLDYTGHVGQS